MPTDRNRDEEYDEELDDEEEPLEDEEDLDDEEQLEDDEELEDEEELEEEEEEEPPPRRRRKKAGARRTSDRKKKAARKKVSESRDEEPRRGRSRRKASDRKRGESRRRPSRRRRRRDRDYDEEPTPRRRSKRRGAAAPRRRKRRDHRDAEASLEIVEPSKVPEADIDLGAELEPVWEPGVLVGGGLGLVGVAFAVVALLTSGGQVATVSVIGLVVLLMAIAAGSVGVLARKSWGYVLGLGASGLGVVGGLLWSLYAVVGTDLTPLWPLFFFLCNLGSVIALFQMRWGPGPLADERDRVRSLKLRTSNHTTVAGEFALAGSVGAVLASVLCGLLLMGSAAAPRGASSTAARFVEGMDLETFDANPEIGSVVLARWGNEDYFFLGRVEQARENNELHIVYLDGDRAWVRRDDLRRDTVRAGASVHIHVQGHDGWAPAVVTQRSGNRIEADVGSQRVWVALGMVRVREAR